MVSPGEMNRDFWTGVMCKIYAILNNYIWDSRRQVKSYRRSREVNWPICEYEPLCFRFIFALDLNDQAAYFT